MDQNIFSFWVDHTKGELDPLLNILCECKNLRVSQSGFRICIHFMRSRVWNICRSRSEIKIWNTCGSGSGAGFSSKNLCFLHEKSKKKNFRSGLKCGSVPKMHTVYGSETLVTVMMDRHWLGALEFGSRSAKISPNKIKTARFLFHIVSSVDPDLVGSVYFLTLLDPIRIQIPQLKNW